jgi:hypothetical protein
MTAEDKKAKMLERVRALMAKADSTDFPAEADTFRDKADELMRQYAIEQWQVDVAQDGVGARPKPISRDVDVAWYFSNSRSKELWQLMNICTLHCRVKLVYWRGSTSIPCVGIPSDLDYFDMLFTSLMLQMGKGLEPHPSRDKPMIENLVVMKEAGMKWERIGELLITAGQLEYYDRNMGVKFTKLYTDYCDKHDRPRLRIAPSVYQRSFAKGFVSEVRTRMRRQESTNTTGMELVLRDIKDEVDAATTEMHGKDPERYALARDESTDPTAYRAGAQAGAQANIYGNPNEAFEQSSQVRGALES